MNTALETIPTAGPSASHLIDNDDGTVTDDLSDAQMAEGDQTEERR